MLFVNNYSSCGPSCMSYFTSTITINKNISILSYSTSISLPTCIFLFWKADCCYLSLTFQSHVLNHCLSMSSNVLVSQFSLFRNCFDRCLVIHFHGMHAQPDCNYIKKCLQTRSKFALTSWRTQANTLFSVISPHFHSCTWTVQSHSSFCYNLFLQVFTHLFFLCCSVPLSVIVIPLPISLSLYNLMDDLCVGGYSGCNRQAWAAKC